MSPFRALGLFVPEVVLAVLVGVVLGRAFARWLPERLGWFLELTGVGVVATGFTGVLSVGNALLLGGELSLDPAKLLTLPWLLGGMVATAAGEILVVATAWGTGRRPFGDPPSRKWLAIGVVSGPILLGLGSAWGELLAATGFAPEAQEVASALLSSTPWVAAVAGIYVTAFAPLLEEGVFRGWLLPLLTRAFGGGRNAARVALVLSSVGFGAMHLDAPWAIPPLMLVGFVCGLLRLRSGSLWPAILAHFGNNLLAMGVVLAGASSSG